MKITVPCVDQEGYQLTLEGDTTVVTGSDLYTVMQEYIFNHSWKQTKKSVFGGGFKKENEKFDPTVQKPCPTCGALTNPKEGVNASGKPYKGWFCPNSRERGCKPIWAS